MGSQKALTLLLAAAAIAAGFLWWAASRGDEGRSAGPVAAEAPADPAPAVPAARLEDPGAPVSDPEARVTESHGVPGGREAVARPQEPEDEESVDEGTRLRGQVLDPEGQPVVGADVFAASVMGMPLDLQDIPPWVERRQTRTDADGRFELRGLRPPAVSVAVRAGGFAPYDQDSIAVPPGEATDIDALVLSRGAILTGRVVGPDGGGVVGAELTPIDTNRNFGFFAQSNRRSGTVVSAGDGAFRIDQLACGPYRIHVDSGDHPPRVFDGEAEVPGREVSGLRFELLEGASISGRVTDVPAHERGQLQVRAYQSGRDEFGFEGSVGSRTTSLEGDAFEVRGLEPGQAYQLQVRRKPLGKGRFGSWGGGSRSTRVRARAGDRGVVLSYRPEATIAFQVLDARTREPVSDMRVSAGVTWPQPVQGEDGRTRKHFPDGRVQVDGLRPDSENERVQLDVVATGYQDYSRDDLQVVLGEELDLGTILLEPVPVVRVRVLDRETGEPVVGARVRLSKELPEEAGGFVGRRVTIEETSDDHGHPTLWDGGRSTRTDEDGLAELTSFEGETCALSVSSSDHAPFELTGLYLPPGDVVEREVRLGTGGKVIVTVLSADGDPLAGTRLSHRAPGDGPGMMILGDDPSASGVTGAEGRAVFERLEPGVHSFKIQEGGDGGAFFARGASVRIEGMPEQDDSWTEALVGEGETVEVTLYAKRRGSLTGRVREAGELLAGANLSLADAEDSGPMRGMRIPGMGGGPEARSDGNGEYRIDDVEVGRYRLTVRHPTRSMPDEYEVEIEEGDNVLDLELAVSVVEGRIVDPDGKPLAGIKVDARRAATDGQRGFFRAVMIADTGDDAVVQIGGVEAESGYTDSDGRYRLRAVTPDVELYVAAEGDEVQPGRSEEFRVKPDETKRGIDLVMEAGGAIEVEALLPDGSPARFLMVNAQYQGEEGGVDPKFAFIQSGTTTLRGLKPGPWTVNLRRAGPGRIEGDEGQDQEVDVESGETGRTTFHVE